MPIRIIKRHLRELYSQLDQSAVDFIERVQTLFAEFENRPLMPDPQMDALDFVTQEINLKAAIMNLGTHIRNTRLILGNPNFSIDEQVELLYFISNRSNYKKMRRCFDSSYKNTGFFSLWY